LDPDCLLDTFLLKLKTLLRNTVDENIYLTGILSALSIFPPATPETTVLNQILT
jgi:hypothetical protein